MSTTRESWVRFVAKCVVMGAVVLAAAFVGNRLANAGPGDPVRKALTVSGVLRGVTGTVTATFRFYRATGDTAALCAPEVTLRDGMERDASTGAFSVEVPLDQAGHVCPDTLFHDPSAFVEVAVNGTTVVTRRPIDPVPYAVYAQQYGTPDCPVGYEHDRTATPVGAIVCARRLARDAARGDLDYVVRVGSGATAFWIDLYEASVTTARDGSGDTLFDRDGNIGGLPRNGQWGMGAARPASPPAFAFSRAGALPARWVTWFQAQELCRASGKRLPTGEEWLAAAQGTRDPGVNDGNLNSACNTMSPTGLRAIPDRGSGCQSVWGAQDMIGNLSEWTLEWNASPNRDETGFQALTWPDGYNADSNVNIRSYARASGTVTTAGLPAAGARGATYADGTGAGIFSYDNSESPAFATNFIGFRCVIPR